MIYISKFAIGSGKWKTIVIKVITNIDNWYIFECLRRFYFHLKSYGPVNSLFWGFYTKYLNSIIFSNNARVIDYADLSLWSGYINYNNPVFRKIYLLINNSIYPNICTYSFKVSLNLLCTLNYDWLNESLYKSKDNKFHICGPCVHLKHAHFFYFFNILIISLSYSSDFFK